MYQKQLAPIVVFVYNRSEHSFQTLDALANNHLAKDSTLYIYADGPKFDADDKSISEIKKTREIIKQKKWCGSVTIIESDVNKGLATSIVEGVTEIINKHGKAIVLEDDIVSSPFFLEYMNDALNLYEDEDKVMHISAFTPYTTGVSKLPETFFLRFMSCWGWGTWKRSWDKLNIDTEYFYNTLPQRQDFNIYNLDGTNDIFGQIVANYKGVLKTWAVKWYSSIFINEGLCLYPRYSLVKNIGFDGSGANCFSTDTRYDIVTDKRIDVKPIKIKASQYAYHYLKRFYKYGNDSSLYFRFSQSSIGSYLKKLKRLFK